MAWDSMLGFENDRSAGHIKLWLDDGNGSELSTRITVATSVFQDVLRDCNAADEGTIRWFGGDAARGAIRIREADCVMQRLGMKRL